VHYCLTTLPSTTLTVALQPDGRFQTAQPIEGGPVHSGHGNMCLVCACSRSHRVQKFTEFKSTAAPSFCEIIEDRVCRCTGETHLAAHVVGSDVCCFVCTRSGSMADRKRRRVTAEDTSVLRRLLHTGGITVNGLSSLLDSVRGTDLPHTGLHHLRDANAECFLEVRHTIRLPLVAGGTWEWEIADPNKLLQFAIDHSPYLRGLFAAAVRQRMPTATCPWHLVIGFDEFMPGSTE
jgi:hypothetical protein